MGLWCLQIGIQWIFYHLMADFWWQLISFIVIFWCYLRGADLMIGFAWYIFVYHDTNLWGFFWSWYIFHATFSCYHGSSMITRKFYGHMIHFILPWYDTFEFSMIHFLFFCDIIPKLVMIHFLSYEISMIYFIFWAFYDIFSQKPHYDIIAKHTMIYISSSIKHSFSQTKWIYLDRQKKI